MYFNYSIIVMFFTIRNEKINILNAGTHSIQHVNSDLTADNSMLKVDILFVSNSSAWGAQIALIPQNWTEQTCEDLIRENYQKVGDSITKSIKVNSSGVFDLYTYVVVNNTPDPVLANQPNRLDNVTGKVCMPLLVQQTSLSPCTLTF